MRYSRQREAIYEVIKNTTCHPDAEWVYEKVKKIIPDISLGTVYRNLKSLADSKQLLTLETEKKSLHYDADLSPHMHFICTNCGNISDLFMQIDMSDRLKEQGMEVESEKVVFYGKCKDCVLKG